MIRHIFLMTAAFAVSGCMTDGGGMAADASGAQAMLSSADGGARGTARFVERSDGIAVTAQVQGLPPGVHGIHVHATGKCEAPDFQTAGPHWNPTEKKHGRENPQGAHAGDLPNISVGADGRGELAFTVSEARFAQLFDADGAAIVVHATADDGRTDPSGSSGARIACGVIARR